MADTLVIIPTYNERDSLAALVGRVRQRVPGADVLIIDDSSPDGTGELADRLASDDPVVGVVHRARKDGLGRAYLTGFHYAMERGYHYIVEIDADGSHDPADLPAMVRDARNGASLVLGSRWVPGGSVLNWPWARRMISRIGNSYARAVLGSRIRDLTSGFRVFRVETLRSLDLSAVASQGYCFQIELAWLVERRGLLVVEHPITFVERAAGRSKMHIGIVIEALARVTVWGITGRRTRR
ncbi:dolichol-phosphate mannosyltransferase [Cryobacterium mesophilum]|uniref:Polyprenol monophosphomannose synthase n=1 Tax=Terrimesophilobacter mesophilus TaxID=433647 RepID=A0A4R8V7W6_9MICO|nr:polyprenol monophosphomannose synthase [Terrimesophilobacter mesophilus]MBB5632007.1 dolichol-phosphate mannosyltransferase [Terrimesophilobacter mesophilus]TFB78899.1 polyprenol monophosphomannose synthase [Terrimesophilobacter mesophilus]